MNLSYKKVTIKKGLVRNLCVSFAVVGSLCLVVGPVTSADTQKYYKIVANGEDYGVFDTKQEAVNALIEARRQANSKSGGVLLSQFEYDIVETGKDADLDNGNVISRLSEKLLDNQIEEKVKAYVIKADGYSVTLESEDAAAEVLKRILNQYDINNEFSVAFADNADFVQNMLKADVSQNTETLVDNITSLSFVQDIYIMPVYTVESEISTVDEAVASIISENKIGVFTTKVEQYTEQYNLDTEYIQEEDWYTSQLEVVQEAQSGVHDVTASVTYLNGEELYRDIISDNVVSEPVAKVVKVGTKEAPTFIKPLCGGSFSSPFGSRWGRRHEGVDWSCSVGNTIFASCGGTVTFTGWQNGYGNTIIISHGDGLKTRYAHLSSISVSSGDKVSQGQTIGKSGNTGNSTGPHLHFEILLNGEPVNPMNYL